MLKLDSRCPFYVGCFFTWGTCSCMGAYNSYCKCPHCPGCALLGVPSIPILQLTPYVFELPGVVHNLCVPPNQKQSSE